MSEQKKHWFVIYTRPRWEKKVARLLDEKGIEHYCPLNKVIRKWTDRKKVIYEPLFKGYIFVKMSEDNKWSIKTVEGVLNYVYWLGKPAIVKDEEIDTIRKFLNEFNDVQVVDFKMDVNTAVQITGGVFMSHKGIVLEVIGNKARVRIDSMGVQLIAIFDKKNLEPQLFKE